MERLPVDDLRVFVVNSGCHTRLEVGGEIDLSTAATLRDELELLIEAGSADIDIDMSQVAFCDSTGLHALLDTHRHLHEHHRRMRIINASPQVARLLELTGLTAQLTDHH